MFFKLWIFLLAWTFFPGSAIGSGGGRKEEGLRRTNDGRSADCSTSDNGCGKRQGAIRKRLIELLPHPDTETSLLEAGILSADFPLFSYQLPINQAYYLEKNSPVEYVDKRPLSQQGHSGLVNSRHPTKPVYHYTPLPAGTFQAKPVNEDQEKGAEPDYWFNYLVRENGRELEMGQRETKEQDMVRGVYHVLLPDHRTQVVRYWSDWSGYHPSVAYF